LLTVSERHAPLLRQGVSPGGEPLVLTLKRTSRVRGKVVDRATGAPVAGAAVGLVSGDGAADLSAFMRGGLPAKEAGAVSDAGGIFLLEKAVPGRARVRAVVGGYGPGLSEEFELPPGRDVG